MEARQEKRYPVNMSNSYILESLEQDIEDLKGLVDYKKYCISQALFKSQARAVLLNLQEHLQALINDEQPASF